MTTRIDDTAAAQGIVNSKEPLIKETLINLHTVIPAYLKGTSFGRLPGSRKIKNIDSGLRRNDESISISLIEFPSSRRMPGSRKINQRLPNSIDAIASEKAPNQARGVQFGYSQ